ncbi:MAG TPA: TIGR02281 family clan AA aspartic protease [Geminicoccaceae bacterium]|nr:TIGR02281 family clan AA aspartic protease [Geminicoccaceae bacterium]
MLEWALRAVVGYTLVGLLLATAYRNRDEVVAFAGGVRPAGDGLASTARLLAPLDEEEVGWNELVVTADRGGHFVVEARVNGTPTRFLIDTGASSIVLAAADARRLGFHPAGLDFSQRFGTANGVVRGAPVTLREVRLGQFALRDVPASVNEGALGISLLGMSYLSRLRGYEVRNDRLVLRW